MDKLVYFLVPVGLAATLLILAVGVFALAKGGAFAKANSNRLMRLRVIAQGVTIVLMLVFLILVGRGPGT